MTTEVANASQVPLSSLPAWSSVLAVVAHPDDESFGLGAVLARFHDAGARVEVLCLTRGEASTLRDGPGELARVRADELAAAAAALGVDHAALLHHPDGALAEVYRTRLAGEVVAAAERVRADGLVVFDELGVTGHPDHVAATAAAVLAAESLAVPVLAWTLPEAIAAQLNEELGTAFHGHRDGDIDIRVAVDREPQLRASRAHASQALPSSVLWRRLELLGDVEHLRWLRPRASAVDAGPIGKVVESAEGRDGVALRVLHRGGDEFDILVRGHVLTVDQPEADGGDDSGPTPTELFVAGLASCVAFYARRYLSRHQLPTAGLAVETSYELARKPARVGTVSMRLVVPDGVPPERREALLAVASHCTVHNSLVTPPEVSLDLVDQPQG